MRPAHQIAILAATIRALAGAPLSAQPGSVSGSVVDRRGAALAGAEVSAVGTALTTRTDARGRIELRGLSTPTVTIRVRLIPYRPVEVTAAAGATDLRIELDRGVVDLQEVVVTGTAGGAQRREVANAVATVRVTEAVPSAPILSLGQLINARAPGVSVSPPSGDVGGGERILIRGRSSLTLRVTPLIYVDGVRVDNLTPLGGDGIQSVSRLNDFHPEEIESVEIIKGPAAGTLYGTEASSGVIQILTKRGKAGPATIGVSTRSGVAYFNDAEGRWLTSYYRDPTTQQILAFNLAQEETDRGTPLFRTGLLQGYSLDVNGGTDAMQYYGAAHFDKDEGVTHMNEAKKFGGRLNLNITPGPKWDANAQLGFASLRTELPDPAFMFGALLTRPTTRDTPQRGFFTAPTEVWVNEFSTRENADHLTGGAEVRHHPISWLSHRLRAGFDLVYQDDVLLGRRMTPESARFFSPGDAAGLKQFSQRHLASTTVDYSASATVNPTTSLRLVSTIGAQYYRQNLTTLGAFGRTFPAPDVTSISGAATTFGTDDRVDNVTVGLFGQEQVSWKNRIFVTVAVRGDDNSAFGRSFDFVTYPKFSASWVVSEEPFWKTGMVDNLRLRAAWGMSGQQPQAFAALRTFQPVTGQAGGAAVTPQFVGNEELGPEKARELELGFDASLFRQRIGVEFTFYNQLTQDAIVLRDIAPSSGFPQKQFVNAGEVRNRGFELLVDGRVIDSRSFSWDLGFNFSLNSNKVLTLGIPGTEFLEFGFGNRFQPGFPVYGIFSKRIIQADRDASGRPINAMCDGGLPGGLPGGGPVSCATAPHVYLGRVDPKIDGAVSSSIRLGGRLTVSGLLDFKRGHRLWTSSLFCPGILGCEEEFFPERFDPVKAASTVLGMVDDWEWFRDVSFAKLREVSVSYQLPAQLAQKFGATRAMVSLAGRNLHTWTKFQGLDPENVGNYSEGAPEFGTPYEQNEVPQPRQFVVRINLSF